MYAIIFLFGKPINVRKNVWQQAIKFSEIVIATNKTKEHRMSTLYITQETREKKTTVLQAWVIVKVIDTKGILNIKNFSKNF